MFFILSLLRHVKTSSCWDPPPRTPWTSPDQILKAEAAYCPVCSARPISFSVSGEALGTMGLPEEQQWTTEHSVTPFPSSDPRPRPHRPSGIFQVPHSSISQPSTSQDVQQYKAGTAGLRVNGDVLMWPPASL